MNDNPYPDSATVEVRQHVNLDPWKLRQLRGHLKLAREEPADDADCKPGHPCRSCLEFADDPAYSTCAAVHRGALRAELRLLAADLASILDGEGGES